MPKIRLIKIKIADYYNDYTYDQDLYESPLSDWVEITDNELEVLESWQAKSILRNDNVRIVVWEDITSRENVLSYIKDVKDFIKKEKEKQEREKKKREDVAALRKEKAEKTKLRKVEELLRKHKML